ncbi:MAG TPA: hypothetical protein VIC60_02340 [Thermomicrobiales bacterium]
MDNQRNAGWPNQPGQGPPSQPPGQPFGQPPGMPPGAAPPPYGQPPGASYNPPPGGPPPYQPPSSPPPHAPPPPGVGAPYGAPPYGQPQPYGQPPSYGPPPTPGVPPGQAFPPGYRPGQPYAPSSPQYAPPAYTTPAPKKRKLWIIPVAILGGLIIVAIIAAVVYQATLTPAVTSIQFAHNFQNNKAVGVTDTFKSTDPDLYAIIKLNTSRGHPTIKVVWTVVSGTDANTQPVTGREFGQAEKDATSKLIYAQVSRGTAPWAVGQYKAEVFLNGKLAKTAQFTVTA